MPTRTTRNARRTTTLTATGRMVRDVLRRDLALTTSVTVGGLLGVVVWLAYGWTLPTSLGELVDLSLTAVQVAGVVLVLALYAVVPRLVAGRIRQLDLDGGPRHGGRSTDRGTGPRPGSEPVNDRQGGAHD